jgi:hypothetical protein
VIEATLARGDRTLEAAILGAARENMGLTRAMKGLGIEPDRYLSDESYLRDAPFHRVDSGVRDEFLLLELERARSGRSTPPCPARGCSMCGICD